MLYQDENEDVKGAHSEKETKQEQTDRLKGQLKRNADKLREAKAQDAYWKRVGEIQEDMMEEQKEWQPIPVQEGEEDWKSNPAIPEPMPQGEGRVILPDVIKDMVDRSDAGKTKYGTRLRINNGRNALMDAYQEAIDLVFYLKQALMEQKDRKISNG